MSSIDVIDERKLEELKRKVELASNSGMSATEFAIDRCRICIDVGKTLLEWKSVLPHGSWQQVYDRIGVQKRTAQKWMRVAQAVSDQKILPNEIAGLRKLYVLLGIVPKGGNEKSTDKGNSIKPDNHILLANKLHDSLTKLPVSGWTLMQRKTLADILRPIVDFHRKL